MYPGRHSCDRIFCPYCRYYGLCVVIDITMLVVFIIVIMLIVVLGIVIVL